jgi:predicted glycoside hydrolase/deacetylase ChbG (UPF0249 family)
MGKGVVSSTSAMVCDRVATELLLRYANRLAGRVGLHLQLTDGFPCAASARVRSLVKKKGRFPRFPEGMHAPDPDEIRVEWRAQLECFRRSGLAPSHIDTHHHVHADPAIFEIYCEMAQRCGVPARTLNPKMTASLRSRGIRCADHCETAWLGPDATLENLLESVGAAFNRCGGHGVVELMCHPGHTSKLLSARSVYFSSRDEELRILCSGLLARGLRQLGVEVAGMAAVPQGPQLASRLPRPPPQA